MKLKMSMLLFVSSLVCFAQEDLKEREKQAAFDPAYSTYSRKKPAFVTLKDASEIEAQIKGVGRKKGQIAEIVLIGDDKKKIKIKADEIASLFMAPSGMEQLQQQSNFFSDASKWGKTDAAKYASKGYTMYTNEMVSLKNKKKPTEYLMQVVNPKFSNVMQVFSDPFAKESMSFGVGSLKLAGGIKKSYYIKKGEEKVLWLTKKDFDKHFHTLFMDNDKFKAKYADQEFKWSLLGVYVLDYTEFTMEDSAM